MGFDFLMRFRLFLKWIFSSCISQQIIKFFHFRRLILFTLIMRIRIILLIYVLDKISCFRTLYLFYHINKQSLVTVIRYLQRRTRLEVTCHLLFFIVLLSKGVLSWSYWSLFLTIQPPFLH